MTNWIVGMAVAPKDGRIIKTFGYMCWPDGSEYPAMRYVWWSWREMPEPTLEEPKRVVKIDQCWEPQGEYPFRPTHWAEADKPPLDLEPKTTIGDHPIGYYR